MAKSQTILAKGPGHLPNRRSHWMESFNCGRTRNDFGVPSKAYGKGYGSSALSAPSPTVNASNRAVTRPGLQIDPSGVESRDGDIIAAQTAVPHESPNQPPISRIPPTAAEAFGAFLISTARHFEKYESKVNISVYQTFRGPRLSRTS
jgi:hypothetical protein